MAKETEVYLPDDLGQEPQPSKKRRLLKFILILLLLIVLVVGGFFLGIYLRLFDADSMNEKMGLYNMPIIGQFFVKPAPKGPDMTDETTSSSKTKVEDGKPDPNAKSSKPVV